MRNASNTYAAIVHPCSSEIATISVNAAAIACANRRGPGAGGRIVYPRGAAIAEL